MSFLLFKNWSVQRKLILLIVSFFVSFAIFVGVSYSTLNVVKVNGSYYRQIIQGNDLLDDLSPSTLNLSSAYLMILRIMEESNPVRLQSEIQEYRQLHDVFETRHEYWVQNLPEGDLKRSVVVTTYEPSREFFHICDEEFLPAILHGDRQKARALIDGSLEQRFLEQNQAVDDATKLATARDEATERTVNQVVQSSTYMMIAIAIGLVVVMVGGFGILISRSVTRELRDTVTSLSVTSSEMAATVEQQERTALHQSSAIHETTATMDELDASFNQTGKMVQTAVDTALQARGVADNGIRTVQQSLEGMSGLKRKVTAVAEQILNLSEHTNQIATITNLVSDLANQTNMLALNAAVESARAGEHGKGFGVIAAEIRKLADESKKSAERISTLVTDIQAATNATVMATEEGTKTVDRSIVLAQETADAFHEVVRTSSTAADTAEQTLLCVPQQVMAVKQVLTAMEALNTNARESADSIGQTRMGMDNLRDATLRLKVMI